ncbi:MAG: siphovirus Gp157 family protein [Culicoidibacterales bacterium]
MTANEIRELIEDGELSIIEKELFKLNLEAADNRETVKQAEMRLNVAKNDLNSVLSAVNEIHEIIVEQLDLMNLEQLGHFKLQWKPPVLVVSENADIPLEYMRIKKEPNKPEIKKALSNGVEIVGCSLERSRKVVVK